MAPLLVLLVVIACLGIAVGVPPMSYSALETLVNLETTFTITSMANNSVPVYRKDLPEDYVAYWEVVVNEKDFVIVSAGPDTGDYRVIFEGSLPTFTSQLDSQSRGRCAKYFMLAPDAWVMCEDAYKKVVASSQQPTTYSGAGVFAHFRGKHAQPYSGKNEDLDKLMQSEITDNEKEFKIRAGAVNKESVWEDVVSKKSVVELNIGQAVKLPVMTSAKVMATGKSSQEDVCRVTGICDPGDKTLVIKKAIKIASYGVKYVEFDVKRLNSDGKKSISFRIVINLGRGRKITRRYVTSQVLRRQRRSWNSKCIPHESIFPEYNQFKYAGCAVGCGPVAWASVFGYLDRRSHYYSYNSHCRELYRSGGDGMTGSSSTIAPKYLDNRMRNYTGRLYQILGTICLFGNGATYAGKMSRIKSFYTSRVPGGKLHIAHGGFWSIFAAYRTKYRNNAIKCIQAGFPAIIGWKISGKLFKQHYPIATCFRSRKQKVWKCSGWWWWKKCKWVWATQYQFYLHMGWGGNRNGWYNAQAYMSACAWY